MIKQAAMAIGAFLALSSSGWAAMPSIVKPAATAPEGFVFQATLRPSIDAIEPASVTKLPVKRIKLASAPSPKRNLIPGPKIVAKVDLSDQRMRVYVNGRERHSWKVSTGRRGYITPKGSFTPYRMHKMWHSRKYNNSPMPYAVFFHKGWAVHGTKAISRLGRPASHGCVRLHPKNAKKFYDLIKASGGMKSAKVVIKR